MPQRVIIPTLAEVFQFSFATGQTVIPPNSFAGPYLVGEPRLRTKWDVNTVAFTFAEIQQISSAQDGTEVASFELQLELVVTMNNVPTFLAVLPIKTLQNKPSENIEKTLITGKTIVLETFTSVEVNRGAALNFEAKLRKYQTFASGGPPHLGRKLLLNVKEPKLEVSLTQEFQGAENAG